MLNVREIPWLYGIYKRADADGAAKTQTSLNSPPLNPPPDTMACCSTSFCGFPICSTGGTCGSSPCQPTCCQTSCCQPTSIQTSCCQPISIQTSCCQPTCLQTSGCETGYGIGGSIGYGQVGSSGAVSSRTRWCRPDCRVEGTSLPPCCVVSCTSPSCCQLHYAQASCCRPSYCGQSCCRPACCCQPICTEPICEPIC
nr:keratin, high-sulfur matrix protein, B2B [Odocoileus virginianus texanus]